MYLDTADPPVVTCGAGHALFNQFTARSLPWKISNQYAVAPDIYKDYQAVLTAPAGHTAAFYEPLTVCRMSDEDIRGLCGTDLQSAMTGLRTYLPQWDQYPNPAIEAICDLAINLGSAWPAVGKWPKLAAAVLANDWATAAVECHRAPPISEERNRAIADLFLEAARSPLDE
jgi:hypothetical protein